MAVTDIIGPIIFTWRSLLDNLEDFLFFFFFNFNALGPQETSHFIYGCMMEGALDEQCLDTDTVTVAGMGILIPTKI